MEVSDVQTLLTILAKQSSERQQQLKKWMMILGISLVSVTAVTTLTLGAIIWNQAKSLENVTATLERRDPILDYLECLDKQERIRDKVQAERDQSQTSFFIVTIEAGDDPDEQQKTLIAAMKENYLLKEQLYIATAESSPTCVVHD